MNVYTGDLVDSHSRYMLSYGGKDNSIHLHCSVAYNLADLDKLLKPLLHCIVYLNHWSQPGIGLFSLPVCIRCV